MSVRLLALVTLLPAVAFAQTWNESFSQSQLDALLGGGSVRVLVAGAGEPADEVAKAAESLRVRLRESGLASLVMGAAALGSLKEDSDDSVRKKAATLPWDRLLTVRVFPGARDAAPTAVITVSEPAGATRRSLVVTRGQRSCRRLPPPRRRRRWSLSRRRRHLPVRAATEHRDRPVPSDRTSRSHHSFGDRRGARRGPHRHRVGAAGEPVPAEELLPAIDAHNAKLEKKPAVSWRLEPSISFDSAGLVLCGAF